MRRVATEVCVIVLAVASAAQMPAQPINESVKQELVKLENAWANAELKTDLAFFEGIFAEDFIMLDSDGVVLTKGQYIANLKSGESVFTSIASDNIKVHIYGDTAVVFGRETLKGHSKGVDISGQYLWTDTWVKIAGHWRCVADFSSKRLKK